MKYRVLKLLHNTPHAPISYWCYALEFLDQVGCYLSKSNLDGRTSSEKLSGQTPDISIFRFAWFQAVWYYNPSLSFPSDKMEPGFFLKLAENTGDGFAYVVLPAKDIKDIPRRRNPVTLVRCVVRPRDLASSCVPRCIKEFNSFKFLNENGEELFSNSEKQTDLPKTEILENTMASEETDDLSLPQTNSSFQSKPSESLTALDVDMPTILEEQEEEVKSELLISEESMAGVDNTVASSATPADALNSPPPSVPMVSQTQDDDEDFPPSDADDDLPRFMEDGGVNTADVASHLNVQLDGKDDYLSAELETIVDDRYLAGVLELQVKYTNGDLSWHPIDLVKNKEP